MKIIIIIILLSSNILMGQDLCFGLGSEINQTRFSQNAPTLSQPFKNPHKSALGISAHLLLGYTIKNKYSINFKPGLSILRTKSDVTSSNNIQYFNIGLELGYIFKNNFKIKAGVEYSYLIKLLSKFNSDYYHDFTFFANHRQTYNPVVNLGYVFKNGWDIHLGFKYFTKDLFNSGALDKNGNIVGPVEVTPYVFSLGFDFVFNKKIVKDFKKKRQRKKDTNTRR